MALASWPCRVPCSGRTFGSRYAPGTGSRLVSRGALGGRPDPAPSPAPAVRAEGGAEHELLVWSPALASLAWALASLRLRVRPARAGIRARIRLRAAAAQAPGARRGPGGIPAGPGGRDRPGPRGTGTAAPFPRRPGNLTADTDARRGCADLAGGRAGRLLAMGAAVERHLETHEFGPHRADVLERADDEGTWYVVLVDGVIATDPPLAACPRFEDVVRIYATSQGQDQLSQRRRGRLTSHAGSGKASDRGRGGRV